MTVSGLPGEGWTQLGELALAFVLSSLVGLEREVRNKSAGLRTYTLVGVASALFMLISKYGFNNVLTPGLVVLDPSRVAAQVVSGLGFIGGGVIFMRRNVVRGLTTAASVWLTAALGMACGAGLLVLAVATTLGHFVIMFVFPRLLRFMPRPKNTATTLDVSYNDRQGVLRALLVECTTLRFSVSHVRITRNGQHEDGEGTAPVCLTMEVRGKRPVSHLISALAGIAGVVEVGTADDDGLD
ncbi:MgtC/SapB family protein [Ameyamaea chiangmaiensis]|uniref:Protein MgtC n=1 Tax=Ameyamaea chiangmaiensis TaxID=442969 RepID=A0A850PIW2_9PROT|nr:MgtC/SapB family protein [Ameyamaea chiangmaiensis]MBS4074703.1 MgtC/SapB family protein [Ameyamaea chiangmaiensis]NVN41742.1 MgtC/SapB family protein [Ameyamaea chiangmaiensis]